MKMLQKIVRSAAVAVLLATGVNAMAFTMTPFDAGTVNVATNGNDSTGDGSEAKPYRTVQKGVDECPVGGTVVLGDGEYSEVGAMIEASQGGTFGTVVRISKRLRLTSKNGKAKTKIVGTWSTENKDGFEGVGEGAVRCIHVNATGTGASAVLIDNLTVMRGAVPYRTALNKNDDNGGGIYSTDNDTNVNNNDRVYVVDCDILDCRAGTGAAIGRSVCPIRCLLARNAAYTGSQVFYRSCHAYNCVFAGNGATGLGLRNGGSGLFTCVQASMAVNCTFLGNFVNAICAPNNSAGCKQRLYNCCALGSFTVGDGALLFNAAAAGIDSECTNCVQTSTVLNCNPLASGISSYQYRSPATGDWAMRTGSGGCLRDAGSDRHYLMSWVPEEYQNTDFLGNPRKVGAHVDIGAIECQGDDDTFTIAEATNGFLYCSPATRAQKGAAVVEPGFWTMPADARQWRVTSTINENLFFGYNLRGQSNEWRFPDRGADNGFWFSPYAPSGGRNEVDAFCYTADKMFYVNGAYTGATTNGKLATPYKTIQAAINACVDTTDKYRINVLPGDYATGSGTEARVSVDRKYLRVVSTAGADETVIRGGDDLRCVFFSNTVVQAVQGFTLTGANLTALTGHGGGAFTKATRDIACQVTDCVVSNNVAGGSGAGLCGVWAQRCLITGNATTAANQAKGTSGNRGTATYAAICSSCVIRNNAKGCTSANQDSWLVNCTMVEDITEQVVDPSGDYKGKTYRVWNTANKNSAALNSVFCGTCDNLNGNYYNAGVIRVGSTVQQVFAVKAYADFSDYFTDAAADGSKTDFRPRGGADGLQQGVETGAGTDANSASVHQYRRYESGDMNGQSLGYGTAGYSHPGAYQVPTPFVRVKNVKGFAVTPGEVIRAEIGQTLTVTVTPDAVHPVVGWVVDGVTNLTGSTSCEVTVTSDCVRVEPLFRSDFYVDANDGDDGRDGLTRATARKTLASILSLTSAGDTVYAARGDYKDNSSVYEEHMSTELKGSLYVRARAVIPAGVTLRSDEGRDVTFITGAADPTTKSTGPDAVRCVTALAGARLVGFTLRNGRVSNTTGQKKDDNVGGGVLAPWPVDGDPESSVLIEDCFITNCAARTAGGVYGGIIRKCLLVQNSSTSGGSECEHSTVEQSVLIRGAFGQTSVMLHHGLRSMTLIAGDNAGGASADLAPYSAAYGIENCVLFTPNSSAECVLTNVHHVLWKTGAGKTTFDPTTCDHIYEISEADALTAAGLDAYGRPLSSLSATVDRGDTARVASLADGALDFLGAPRVCNSNAVDIGAYEYDWRGDYVRVLNVRRLTVVAADKSAFVDRGAVVLPTGSLTAVWPRRGLLEMPVEVTGNGTLAVVVNGTTVRTVTQADGLVALRCDLTDASNELLFVYTPGTADAGAAVLHPMANRTGMAIILR